MEITIRRAVPVDGARIADICNQGTQTRTTTFETELRTAEDRQRWLKSTKAFLQWSHLLMVK